MLGIISGWNKKKAKNEEGKIDPLRSRHWSSFDPSRGVKKCIFRPREEYEDYRGVTSGLPSEAHEASRPTLLPFSFKKHAEQKFGVPKAFPGHSQGVPRETGRLEVGPTKRRGDYAAMTTWTKNRVIDSCLVS